MVFGLGGNKELEQYAEVLKRSVIALFKERGNVVFTKPPQLTRRPIIEYEGKIRADGMDKYNNEVAYVSAVNFYSDVAALEKKKPLGVLVVYVQFEFLPRLMKLLQYPPIDDEKEQALLDSIGTLCNIVSGRFKSEIKAAGYKDLEMSHFINYRNNAVVGVSYNPKESEYYEMVCEIEGKRRLAIDLTMSPIPKR